MVALDRYRVKDWFNVRKLKSFIPNWRDSKFSIHLRFHNLISILNGHKRNDLRSWARFLSYKTSYDPDSESSAIRGLLEHSGDCLFSRLLLHKVDVVKSTSADHYLRLAAILIIISRGILWRAMRVVWLFSDDCKWLFKMIYVWIFLTIYFWLNAIEIHLI